MTGVVAPFARVSFIQEEWRPEAVVIINKYHIHNSRDYHIYEIWASQVAVTFRSKIRSHTAV